MRLAIRESFAMFLSCTEEGDRNVAQRERHLAERHLAERHGGSEMPNSSRRTGSAMLRSNLFCCLVFKDINVC